ncbi:MAG TPA: His/Gly/Thr/Pro-type tRNA ligase C-terminal domain-containing protein, partial [Dehalococcoidia bacterium]|nr:His/Gly/Thr/Pro-type tRNA ligase C-terminal domain-containing protein [Dehalococcoidia bacterium]
TLLGADVRWFGILLEHYAGAFPVWLAPVQARIIPIADRHLPYARQVKARLEEAGLRAILDDSTERMQAKIRNAQLEKIPYMLVVGDREAREGTISLRLRTEENLGARPLDEFIATVSQVANQKRTDLGFAKA